MSFINNPIPLRFQKSRKGNLLIQWSFFLWVGASRLPWKCRIYQWHIWQDFYEEGITRGRSVWEAIIKGGKIFVGEWGRFIFMKYFLIYNSNSFSFAFCELKNKDFGVVCFFLTRICFQFVHSLGNLFVDYAVSSWTVPGAWVRHKHFLPTLFRNPTGKWSLLSSLWRMPP